MPTINEMIDFCEDMASYDCFSNEQFARREIFYAISDELKKSLREQKRPYEEWIPCSERLPEENKTVMASTNCGVFPEAKYTKEYGWEWAYESGADYWVELEDVTAWMPLPKPYKEEGEENG